MSDIGTELGELSPIRIWHDNNGLVRKNSWFLSPVLVVDEQTQSRFEFPCSKWLSKSHDDKQISRELTCAADTVKVKGYLGEYKLLLDVHEGSKPWNSEVQLEIKGVARLSDMLTLKPLDGPYMPGETYEFPRKIADLGDITAVHIKLPKIDKPAELVLREVKVIEASTGTTWRFPSANPIEAGMDYTILDRSIVEAGSVVQGRSRKPVTYSISTHTSDVPKAGTDAKVHITLFGANGDCGVRALATSVGRHRDKFEKGHEDIFLIEVLDLGELKKVTIGHNSGGLKDSSWHLDRVVVRRKDTGEEVQFPCREWISRKHSDKKTERDLFPSKEVGLHVNA
jgi:hypothetical protein